MRLDSGASLYGHGRLALMDRRGEKGEAPCIFGIAVYYPAVLPPRGADNTVPSGPGLGLIAWVDPVTRLLFWAITGCHLSGLSCASDQSIVVLPTPEYQYIQIIRQRIYSGVDWAS